MNEALWRPNLDRPNLDRPNRDPTPPRPPSADRQPLGRPS